MIMYSIDQPTWVAVDGVYEDYRVDEDGGVQNPTQIFKHSFRSKKQSVCAYLKTKMTINYVSIEARGLNTPPHPRGGFWI